jgi:hypothetical protein
MDDSSRSSKHMSRKLDSAVLHYQADQDLVAKMSQVPRQGYSTVQRIVYCISDH